MLPISTPLVIDTHCHLNFKAFKDDVSAVIERAKSAGVLAMIVVGSDLATSRLAVELANKYAYIWAAVGYHPIHTTRTEFIKNASHIIKELEVMARDERVVAIGETGLDYYHKPLDKEAQKELFLNSMDLALRLKKRVILHSREAFGDMIELINDMKVLPKGVMHCYPGNWQQAQMVLAKGFYLGFTGLITYSGDIHNLEVVQKAPLDKLLIETDSPYLTPIPHRGERNEPKNVILVAEEVAKIRHQGIKKVAEATTQNAQSLFNFTL